MNSTLGSIRKFNEALLTCAVPTCYAKPVALTGKMSIRSHDPRSVYCEQHQHVPRTAS